jgi:hypothetical protein
LGQEIILRYDPGRLVEILWPEKHPGNQLRLDRFGCFDVLAV